MKITRMIADGCVQGDCPATYALDNGDFAFKGYEITDPDVLAQAKVTPGERLIVVPRSLLAEHYREQG